MFKKQTLDLVRSAKGYLNRFATSKYWFNSLTLDGVEIYSKYNDLKVKAVLKEKCF